MKPPPKPKVDKPERAVDVVINSRPRHGLKGARSQRKINLGF
jgi:hypothetical protein